MCRRPLMPLSGRTHMQMRVRQGFASILSRVRVTRDDVLMAGSRIDGRVRRTPLMRPSDRDALWFKCEFLQHCGVFKTRGAFNRQLAGLETGEIGHAGIVVASGGNAGLAQAFVARELGIPATVFVPMAAPEVKVERIEAYGAEVRRGGAEYAEAYQAAVTFAEESGASFAHAYDQFEVAAGAGTLGEEILEDEPSIDTIIVAVGGGGLYAGVAAAAFGRARIVAVEPQRCPTLNKAMSAGQPVDVSVSGVAADALGARRVGLRRTTGGAADFGSGYRRGHRQVPFMAVGRVPHALRVRRGHGIRRVALGSLRSERR
jgi:threonine dehydratase